MKHWQRVAQDAGLPVPKVFETVKRDGREGVVYERIEGPSLLNELGKKPWKAGQCARLLAGLHARVHDVSAPPGLETQHEWATNQEQGDARRRMSRWMPGLATGSWSAGLRKERHS